jgi:hypothetical protein
LIRKSILLNTNKNVVIAAQTNYKLVEIVVDFSISKNVVIAVQTNYNLVEIVVDYSISKNVVMIAQPNFNLVAIVKLLRMLLVEDADQENVQI